MSLNFPGFISELTWKSKSYLTCLLAMAWTTHPRFVRSIEFFTISTEFTYMKYDELCSKIHYKFWSNLKLPSDLSGKNCKMLHLWTFASYCNISIQLNEFSLINEQSTYICMHVNSFLLWKTRLYKERSGGLGAGSSTYFNILRPKNYNSKAIKRSYKRS